MQHTEHGQTEDMTAYDFHRGTDTHAYAHMGVHALPRGAGDAYRYRVRVFAPHAEGAALCSEAVEGGSVALRRVDDEGIFEAVLTSPIPLEGMRYRFRFTGAHGSVERADPYARCALRDDPRTSVLCEAHTPPAPRRGRGAGPMHVYAVHLGSFATRGGRSNADGEACLNYRELGRMLSRYVADMGYTHVLLLPLTAHAADVRCGTRPVGLFAPSARHGSPDDLRAMIDMLHDAGLAVLMALPLGAFDARQGGLALFDGEPLYECEQGGGYALSRPQVRNYVLSAALYWLRAFGLDGLCPLGLSADGTPHGAQRRALLRTLCAAVRAALPAALLLGEREEDADIPELSAVCRPHVTRQMAQCLHAPPADRAFCRDRLLLSLTDPSGARAMLPLTPDARPCGRGGAVGYMHGTYLQRFAALRLCMAYLIAHPGSKYTFMGAELAQPHPFDPDVPPDWYLTDIAPHAALHADVRTLNRLYRDDARLWRDACAIPVAVRPPTDTVLAFFRGTRRGRALLAVFSLGDAPCDVALAVGTGAHTYRRIFPADGAPAAVTAAGLLPLSLPPLAAQFWESVLDGEKNAPMAQKSSKYP